MFTCIIGEVFTWWRQPCTYRQQAISHLSEVHAVRGNAWGAVLMHDQGASSPHVTLRITMAHFLFLMFMGEGTHEHFLSTKISSYIHYMYRHVHIYPVLISNTKGWYNQPGIICLFSVF